MRTITEIIMGVKMDQDHISKQMTDTNTCTKHFKYAQRIKSNSRTNISNSRVKSKKHTKTS